MPKRVLNRHIKFRPEETDLSKKNVSVSAYRVLYILLLLVRHRNLTLVELNGYLSENKYIRRPYNGETITKYINTLRKAGCAIPRANSGYQLLKAPMPLSFEEEQLSVAHKLLMLLSTNPDEDLHVSYQALLKKVLWVLGEDQQQQFVLDTATPICFGSRKSKISEYKELCKDSLLLEIQYKQSASHNERYMLEPIRVTQEDRAVYLVGIERTSHMQRKLNLDKILSLKQLPYKTQSQPKPFTASFRLTGRLACSYRLYPGETIESESKNEIVIKSQFDDGSMDLKRLLKYGSQCEVLSPEPARMQMKTLIASLSMPMPGAAV
ncbi:MAG: WYL domain-containing protein [Vampirovibrio sp.]|nr:WYL domain-containing protein [Vampirovibrio sp.]